jgi:hypothetical protein
LYHDLFGGDVADDLAALGYGHAGLHFSIAAVSVTSRLSSHVAAFGERREADNVAITQVVGRARDHRRIGGAIALHNADCRTFCEALDRFDNAHVSHLTVAESIRPEQVDEDHVSDSRV